jgi:ferredoxin
MPSSRSPPPGFGIKTRLTSAMQQFGQLSSGLQTTSVGRLRSQFEAVRYPNWKWAGRRPPYRRLPADTLTEKARERIFALAMTKLPPARAKTTEAFLVQSGPELAALCTECGACFNACPMVDYVNLRGADPRIVTGGLRRLASGEAAPEKTVVWVGACTKSGQCVDACPQKAVGLDAMLLVRIAKQRALNETRQLPAKQDPSYFPRIKTFARLQLSDEELEKWL